MAYYAYPGGPSSLVLIQSKPVNILPGQLDYVWDAMRAPFTATLLRAELTSEECSIGSTIYVDVWNETTGNGLTRLFPGPITAGLMTGDDVFVCDDSDIGLDVTVMDKLKFQYTSDSESFANNAMVRLWLHPSDPV